MVFPFAHVYWTFHWDIPNVPEEGGQIGLRATTPGTPPTLTTVTEVGAAFRAFWTATDSVVPSTHRFVRVKAALIRPDGTYDPDYDPVVVDVSPALGATTGATSLAPLQVAHTIQLTTDRSSGPAHAGRVYLPHNAGGILLSTLGYDPGYVQPRVANFATFIAAMNAAMGGETVQVMSALGAGASRTVVGVRADNRADVQRRRARQQPYVWGAEVSV